MDELAAIGGHFADHKTYEISLATRDGGVERDREAVGAATRGSGDLGSGLLLDIDPELLGPKPGDHVFLEYLREVDEARRRTWIEDQAKARELLESLLFKIVSESRDGVRAGSMISPERAYELVA